MNVLIVSHLALPHVGGVENLVDLEIRALAQAGHSVTLITSNGTGSGSDPCYPEHVRVVRVPAYHGLERRFGIPYPIFSLRILSATWNGLRSADLVHVHGFLFQGSFVALMMARMNQRPSILTDHGGIQKFSSRLTTELARLGAETLGRLTTLLADRAIAYNERIRHTLARFRRKNDVELILNPVDRERFFPPTLTERNSARENLGWDDRPRILFVGRLIATKGVPLVLTVACPEWELVFCGPGDTSILGPLPRALIAYLPPRPQDELRQLYHAADVLVLPAEVREGFPLVVQEALCCGLPVVLGWDPGFTPYQSLTGLTFTERNTDALRNSIALALTRGRHDHCDGFPTFESWTRLLLGETAHAT